MALVEYVIIKFKIKYDIHIITISIDFLNFKSGMELKIRIYLVKQQNE